MYSVRSYGEMMADAFRTDAYARAIREVVKPGSVVLDIGTGTGLFAILAARAGARRVYAVEHAGIIDVARQFALANGCSDSIEFLRAISTEITLPEPANVIVSDLRGVLPFYETHLVALADARNRFLAPDGVLIPQRDTLWVGCVEAADLHRRITAPWSDSKYGVTMKAGRGLVINKWHRTLVKPEQLLSDAHCLATIDYATVEGPNFSASATLAAAGAGTAHGLCMWFDSILAEGVRFTNSPSAPELVYGHAFFPWPQPISLDAGDTVAIHVRATLVADDYLWSWETRICAASDCGEAKAHFKQSEFFGEPWSVDKLQRQAADHVPTLNYEAQIDRLILKLMEEQKTLGDIARQVASRFPMRFSRWQDALTRVGELSTRYSR